MAAVAALFLSSCYSDGDGAGDGAADGLQKVLYMPSAESMSIQIEEGTAVRVNFQVVPASYAIIIAEQSKDLLAFVPFHSYTATMSVTDITADADGRLTVTAVPNGTEAGQFYLFALVVQYGDKTIRTDNIKFWRDFVPDIPDITTPSVLLSSERISQTLAE